MGFGQDTSLGVNLIGRDISASSTLQNVGRQAELTSNKFHAMGSMVKGALIGATAAAGAFAVKIGVDSVHAAIEDQAAVEHLSQTLKNVGWSTHVAEIEAHISAMQRATGVGDDELRPAYERIARSADNASQAERTMNVILDVAAGKQVKLATVANAWGRALDGNTTSLGKLGLGLDKATLKTGDMKDITEKVSGLFEGDAAAAAGTFAGRMRRITTAADEAQETIGTALLNAVDGFTDVVGGTDGAIDLIDSWASGIADAIGRFETLIDVLDGVADKVKSIPQLPDWIGGVWNTLGGGRDFAVNLAGALGPAGLNTAFGMDTLQRAQDMFDAADAQRQAEERWTHGSLGDFYQYAGGKGYKPTKRPTPLPGAGGAAKATKAADEISAHWQGILSDAGLKLDAFIASDGPQLGRVGSLAVDKIISGIKIKGSEKTTKAVQDMLGKAFDAVKDRIKAAEDFGKSISDGIMKGFSIGDAASGWQDRQDAVRDALKDLNDAQKALTAESTQAERDRVTELQGIYQKAQEDAAKGGMTIVDSYVASANRAGEFATKLQSLLTGSVKLNQTTWLEIAGLNAEQGIKVIDAFYDAGIDQSIQRANDAVGAVDSVSKQVGNQAIKTFKLAGIETAIAFFETLVMSFQKGPWRDQFNKGLGNLRAEMDTILNPTLPSTAYVPQYVNTGGAPGGIDWSTPGNQAILDQNHWAYENLPGFADGGVIPATPGGRIVRVAEQGQREAIGTLDDLSKTFGGQGGGYGDVVIQVNGNIMSERDLVAVVKDGIARDLRRRGIDSRPILGV